MKMETHDTKSMGHSKSSSEWEVYSDTYLRKQEKTPNKQSNLTSKGTRKRTNNAQS